MKGLTSIHEKIFANVESFIPELKSWKASGQKIAFTNGCFDILHRGHVEYLATASGKADKLIIGLNSDLSVRNLKGRGRPLNDQIARAILLAAMSFVDAVVIFDQETPALMIEQILPDYLIKGNDYTIAEIAGHETVLAHGGKVETIDLVPGYSTTGLFKRIRKLPE